MVDDFKIIRIVSFISIILLIIALFDMPYPYYRLLRFLLFVGAGFISFVFFKLKYNVLILVNIAICTIYNPLFPLHMNRIFWTSINIITIIGFVFNILQLQKIERLQNEESD